MKGVKYGLHVNSIRVVCRQSDMWLGRDEASRVVHWLPCFRGSGREETLGVDDCALSPFSERRKRVAHGGIISRSIVIQAYFIDRNFCSLIALYSFCAVLAFRSECTRPANSPAIICK